MKSFPSPKFRIFGVVAFAALAACFVSGVRAAQRTEPDLTAHEWGTFTSIAGNDGRALEWVPWQDSDLPEFVEHIGYANLKAGLRGTIRMETPVIYFYSPHEVGVTVKVRFAKGMISEWYPRATKVEPSVPLRDPRLSELKADGSIAWENVAVLPNLAGEFPRMTAPDRYYAARETTSAPLRVGNQQEKFLFYRGVSAAPVPISAEQTAGGAVRVTDLNAEGIPAMVLFERRGNKVGYRVVQSPGNETTIEAPALDGNLDTLCDDLEGILAEQGLYREEARAMVNTWRDSWFEEGSRVIYVVPRSFVDRVLPLTIHPTPAETVRVFVGRMEIVTPATKKAVQAAMAAQDEATLAKYQRFLEPILRMVGKKR